METQAIQHAPAEAADAEAIVEPHAGEGTGVRQACAVLPGRLLQGARILPQRNALLRLLPTDGVFVEVGVALGDFSARILKQCRPRRFIAIDIFTIHESPAIWGKPTAEIFGGRSHEQFYRDRFAGPIAEGRVEVLSGDSLDSLERLDDASADVIYLDADHSYEAVSKELE
ncbi:MAG TPA: class I SAM-dependent methyltransferase, partial [Stellaceae bacterium]|nr:class I SAM-dependent methyltransferase [Stellaceae bacterium]